MPATFVVGKDQRIRFAHVEPDFPRLWFLQASSAVDAGGAAAIPRASGPATTS